MKKEVCTLVTGCAVGSDAGWDDGDATLPADTATVQWRVTVTNTGNVGLNNVHVAQDDWGYTAGLADQGKATDGGCASLTFSDLAAGGGTDARICTMTLDPEEPLEGWLVNGVNVNASVNTSTLPSGAVNANLTDPYGTSLVSRLRGNPEGESEELTAGVVGSNTDIARVRTPEPKLELVKWVCAAGTGCTAPSEDDLEILLEDDAGKPAGGWVKAATVAPDATVQWLILVRNTGNTTLAPVEFSMEELTDGDNAMIGSPDGCAVGEQIVASLAPGETAVLTACSTANVTDLVTNTAQAEGTAVEEDGTTTIPDPETGLDWIAASGESSASADIARPAVDVEKFDGTGFEEDGDEGDRDADDEPLTVWPADTPKVTIRVTNSGNDVLTNIALTDNTTEGVGDVTGWTCDLSGVDPDGFPDPVPMDEVAGSGFELPLGASFGCTGTLGALGARGVSHEDTATVSAVGKIAGGEAVVDKDVWRAATLPAPAWTLPKAGGASWWPLWLLAGAVLVASAVSGVVLYRRDPRAGAAVDRAGADGTAGA